MPMVTISQFISSQKTTSSGRGFYICQEQHMALGT